jgi:hypothetical protein
MLLIGILLIIISVFVGSTQIAQPSTEMPYASGSVVAPNSFVYGALKLNYSNFIFIYNSSNPVNFYLLNDSGFAYLKLYNSVSVFSGNTAGHGVIYKLLNKTQGGVLYAYNYSTNSSANASIPYFITGGSGNKYHGSYFFLFSNQGNTISNVTYEYVNGPLGNSSAEVYSYVSTPGSIVSAILFIAGVVLIFFSLFRKREKKVQSDIDIEASKLYSSISAKSNPVSNKPRSNRQKRRSTGSKKGNRRKRKR